MKVDIVKRQPPMRPSSPLSLFFASRKENVAVRNQERGKRGAWRDNPN